MSNCPELARALVKAYEDMGRANRYWDNFRSDHFDSYGAWADTCKAEDKLDEAEMALYLALKEKLEKQGRL